MPKQNHNLAGPTQRELETFLIELANLRDDSAAISRFCKRFADFGFFDERLALAFALDFPKHTVIEFTSIPAGLHVQGNILSYLRDFFCAAWIEPDAKTRQWAWAVFRTDLARVWHSGGEYLSLRDDLGSAKVRARLPAPPEELPVEKAFDYLLKHHNRARHCLNPECPASYFFAKRHTQRYCSEKCAQAGEREMKRRWWSEHGTAWRKDRKLAKGASKTRRKAPKKEKKGK